MASDLLHPNSSSAQTKPEVSRGYVERRMRKDFIIRFSTVLLAILTATTVVFAIINFQKESQFSTPDDGVWWIEQNGALVAKRVTSGGPGDHAGIKPGDRLLNVSHHNEGLTKPLTVENVEKHAPLNRVEEAGSRPPQAQV